MKLLTYPNELLKKKMKDVDFDELDKEYLNSVISEMFSVMDMAEGVGLAANQAGYDINVAVFAIPDFDVSIMINPRLVEASTEMEKVPEGCLSVPGYRDTVKRHVEVTVEFQDIEGNAHEKTVTGLASQCVQHEIDHLNGITYIDRLPEFKKRKARKAINKFRKIARREK